MIASSESTGSAEKHALPGDLQDRLNSYAEGRSLNNAQLGQMLGVHATVASKLRRGQYDVPIDSNLVARVEDLLKAADRVREVDHALFPTPIARSMAATLETIRATSDFGLISSEAGLGKTSGVELYVKTHPLAIAITATKWAADASAVEARLFGHTDSRGWKFSCRRGEWLVQRLAGSNRLMIVDNAHRLTQGGLAFLFDLHDQTKCPVALVGNPEVLDKIKANDQWFSRIGIHRKLTGKSADADAVVQQLARSLVPEITADGRAMELLTTIAIEPERGHFRSAKKTLLLARQLREGDRSLSWEKAVRAAHTQQPRGYDLPEDGGGR